MDVTFYPNLYILYIYDFNTIFPGKAWSGMFELVDTGNQQSNKEVDLQKYFMYFENTNIQRLKAFKYLFFKGIKYKRVFCISDTYFKYMYLKYCPSLHTLRTSMSPSQFPVGRDSNKYGLIPGTISSSLQSTAISVRSASILVWNAHFLPSNQSQIRIKPTPYIYIFFNILFNSVICQWI